VFTQVTQFNPVITKFSDFTEIELQKSLQDLVIFMVIKLQKSLKNIIY